jgi:hypothetical protein
MNQERVCSNCDGIGCMHIVLRDWWAPDAQNCKGCCPFCGGTGVEPQDTAKIYAAFDRMEDRLAITNLDRMKDRLIGIGRSKAFAFVSGVIVTNIFWYLQGVM